MFFCLGDPYLGIEHTQNVCVLNWVRNIASLSPAETSQSEASSRTKTSTARCPRGFSFYHSQYLFFLSYGDPYLGIARFPRPRCVASLGFGFPFFSSVYRGMCLARRSEATPTCIKTSTRHGANRLTLDEKYGIINLPINKNLSNCQRMLIGNI